MIETITRALVAYTAVVLTGLLIVELVTRRRKQGP